MAIRVTQNTMYNTMVGHMQSNLGAYMESVEQGASQKKINRPSDDPAGTYRVLTTRLDMTNTDQYKENVDTAKGWLNLADNVLSSRVTTAITGLKTLAEQGATGTYTAEQRRIMADQAKQYFGQLLNLANTEFEGKSLFAGHKYSQAAFQQGMAITPPDDEWAAMINSGSTKVEGSYNGTILIEFPGATAGETMPMAKDMVYNWSNDAGLTWHSSKVIENTLEDGSKVFELDPIDEDGNKPGVVITLPSADKDGNSQALNVTTTEIGAKEHGPSNGTFLYVRPTAIYQGDDKDPPAQITVMGDDTLEAKESGTFGGNVLVRLGVDKEGNKTDITMSPAGKQFDWSYSTDGGSTWVFAKGTTTGKNDVRLPLPGGFVELTTNGNITGGSQVLIHPSRADLDYEIMKDTYLSVNSVGKDVFGGYYEDKPAIEGNSNLFEVVGAFIGYLEGNSQEGCQKTLAALTTAEQQILKEATRIGGMENRIEMASDVLEYQKLDQQERLSYVEDIDLTELLTKLTRQQLAYQTVLQSSSMIMQMSLAKYV